MTLWSRLFGGSAPTHPILLRVRSARGAPQTVEVEATWLPKGSRTQRSVVTAEGLCLVPWASGSQRVALALRADGASASVELTIDDARDGVVREVALSG